MYWDEFRSNRETNGILRAWIQLAVCRPSWFSGSQKYKAGPATARRYNSGIHIMNKQEIAATLRNEVGELEVLIKKLQARCDRMKSLVLKLEAEIAGSNPRNQTPGPDSKFRKVIDKVFGEKPKRKT